MPVFPGQLNAVWDEAAGLTPSHLPFLPSADEECQLQPGSVYSGVWDQGERRHDRGDGESPASTHPAVWRQGKQGRAGGVQVCCAEIPLQQKTPILIKTCVTFRFAG